RPGWNSRIADSVMRRLPGRALRSVLGSSRARVGSAQRVTWSRQARSEPPAYQASTNRAVTSRAAAWSVSGRYPDPSPSTVFVSGTPTTIGGAVDPVTRVPVGWGDGV